MQDGASRGIRLIVLGGPEARAAGRVTYHAVAANTGSSVRSFGKSVTLCVSYACRTSIVGLDVEART